MKKLNRSRGFSLVEVLVAMAIGLLIVAGAVQLFKGASDANSTSLARSDIQQNARGALAVISRDLSQASIGIPQAGIPLPSGAGSTAPVFACSAATCYFPAPNDIWPNALLPPVSPHQGIGGLGTDAITIAYLDNTWPVTNLTLTNLAANGTSITVNTGTFDTAGNPTPAPAGRDYADPVFGTKVGDVLMITNQLGTAVGTVTAVGKAGSITLAANDPLDLNQPTAATGNIAALKDPVTKTFPVTSAARINVVTYFIQTQAGPDGLLNTADDLPVLMRQLNAQSAIPIAENVQNLQLTYDTYDSSAVPPYIAGLLGNAVADPSQIRKVNVQLTLRSEFPSSNGQFQRLTVSTAVAPRDLSFKNRYQ
jgi:prepilin-type N-terminal cleavage/methylation domain-containing protein